MERFQDRWYWAIGDWVGGAFALAAFFGSWWYCAATYGYLLGFGLGWLPSGILAVVVSLALKILWGPLVVGVAGLGFLMATPDHHTKPPAPVRYTGGLMVPESRGGTIPDRIVNCRIAFIARKLGVGVDDPLSPAQLGAFKEALIASQAPQAQCR